MSNYKKLFVLLLTVVLLASVSTIFADQNLSGFITGATVNGAEQSDGTYQVIEGVEYNVSVTFAETNQNQFDHNGSLTYKLPSGLIVSSAQSDTLTARISDMGVTYTVQGGV